MQYCDTPWDAIEDTIRRVRSAHPVIDAIYHTGDIVDHGVWETTENGNRQIMDRVYNLLKEVFPNTPIYNAIGNHEGKIFPLKFGCNFKAFCFFTAQPTNV